MVGGVSTVAAVSKGSAVTAASGGSSAASTASKAIMQIAQGAIGDALGAADKSLKLLSTITGFGIPLALINKSLDGLISGIETGFAPVLKIIGAIGKMLGMIIMPFVNLILPLLLPILMILKPIVMFINLALKPLFGLLMTAFKGAGGMISAVTKAILGGDLLGGLKIFIDYIIAQIGTIITTLTPMLQAALQALISMVMGFLSLDMNKVKETLTKLFGPELGGAITFLVDIFHKAGSALIGFIGQIVGKDFFDKFMGKDQFENISKTNEGFKLGTEIGKVFQDLWKALNDFVSSIWPIVANAAIGLGNLITNIITSVDIKTALETMIGTALYFALTVSDFIKGVWQGDSGLEGVIKKSIPVFSKLIQAIKDFIDVTWNGPGGLKSSITSLAKSAAKLASIMSSISKGDIIGAAMKLYAPDTTSGVKQKVGDAIIAPGGRVITTDPNDYLIATKNPSSLSGGTNNFTININGSGLSEGQLQTVVRGAIENFMADSSRRGYFFKGY